MEKNTFYQSLSLNGKKAYLEEYWNLTLENHMKTISKIVISKNKNEFITCSLDKSIKVWDIFSGKLVNKYEEHSEAVNNIIFSKNEDKLVSCSDDWTIIIWENADKLIKKNTLFKHNDPVNDIALIHDDYILVSGSQDMKIILWYFLDQSIYHIIDASIEIVYLAAHRSYEYVVYSDKYGVYSREIEWPDENNMIIPESGITYVLTNTKDTKYLIAGSDWIYIWNFDDFVPGTRYDPFPENNFFKLQNCTATALTTSEDSLYLIISCDDNNIIIYNFLQMSSQAINTGYQAPFTSICIWKNQDKPGDALEFKIAGSVGCGIRSFDFIDNCLLTANMINDMIINKIYLSSDNSFIFTINSCKRLDIWRINDLKYLDNIAKDVKFISINEDFLYCFIEENEENEGNLQVFCISQISLKDETLETKNIINPVTEYLNILLNKHTVSEIFITNKNNYAIIIEKNSEISTIFIYNLHNLNESFQWAINDSECYQLSSDNIHLILFNNKNTYLKFNDLITGTLNFKLIASKSINCIDITKNNKLIAIATINGDIEIWNILKKQRINLWKPSCNQITGILILNNKKNLIVSSNDNSLSYFSLSHRKENSRFKDYYTDKVTSICFFNNQQFLAIGSFDKTIKIWDLKNNILSKCFMTNYKIENLAIVLNDQYIIANSIERQLIFWSICEEIQICSIKTLIESSSSLNAKKNKKYAVICIDHKIIQVYKLIFFKRKNSLIG